jgi:predicted signal transduction protein with EAL and GGDEF domain
LLRRVLSDLSQWPNDIRVSFNLSVRNLSSPDTMLQIVATLNSSRVDPARIDFEVTETSLMIDFESALRSLTMLRNLGCGISLDDFGTGHSSLSYINRLPLDKIKIDRSFVVAMATDHKTREIVNTIASLGKNLGLECVAEGVETAEQVELMAECGCGLMQGYYYSRPMLVKDVTRLIEQEETLLLDSVKREVLRTA